MGVITKDEGIGALPDIYTTGAFLYPLKYTDNEGATFWTWAVSEFDGDCFYGGEVFNPPESATALKKLVVNTTAENYVREEEELTNG